MLSVKSDQKALILVSAHLDPLPTSAAKMMSDLARKAVESHDVYVITQTATSFGRKKDVGYVYGLRNPFIKTKSSLLRLICEIIFPILLSLSFGIYLRLKLRQYNLILYSPTTMQWPLTIVLKKSKVKQFLILRDLFPDWLADAKILGKKSIAYMILDHLSRIQYSLSDVIGCQSERDIERLAPRFRAKALKLNSFYDYDENGTFHPHDEKSNITRFCYVGSFYVAQDWKKVIKILNKVLTNNKDIRVDFFGTGNPLMTKDLFNDEVKHQVTINDPLTGNQLEACMKRYDVGLFSLSSDIRNSNIPGKFLMYCKLGMPSLAIVSPDTEVGAIIKDNNLGAVGNIDNETSACKAFSIVIQNCSTYDSPAILNYFKNNYSVDAALTEILIHIE